MFITPALLISTSMSSCGLVGERVHGGEVGEVEAADLGLAADLGGRTFALGRVAHGEDHACVVVGERAGGFEADAAVGAGDDERAAGEAGEVGGGPVIRAHDGDKVDDDNNDVNDNM